MVSEQNVGNNLKVAETLIRQAAVNGAKFVLLPEFFAIIANDKMRLASMESFIANPQTDALINNSPIQNMLASLAKSLNIWIVGGSVPLISPKSNKTFNTMLAYNPLGECIVRYDKIHLFNFCHKGETYNEHEYIEEGSLEQPLGWHTGKEMAHAKIGASICYDLRFPEHYQRIQAQLGGMDILLLPAAFIYTTGRSHWEILLRARAIENQCYVLASGQGGVHENGRRTFGNSMIINPWGDIIAQTTEGEAVVMAAYQPQLLNDIRSRLPALANRRWGQQKSKPQ